VGLDFSNGEVVEARVMKLELLVKDNELDFNEAVEERVVGVDIDNNDVVEESIVSVDFDDEVIS